MEIIKIKLHSSVDLITNSSTVIFTYQDNSIEPVRNLFKEIFKTFNVNENVDDIFTFSIEQEDKSDWSDWEPDSYLMIECKDEKYKVIADKIKDILNSVSADGGYDG